jgi:hypothetical protein
MNRKLRGAVIFPSKFTCESTFISHGLTLCRANKALLPEKSRQTWSGAWWAAGSLAAAVNQGAGFWMRQ